MAAATTWRPGAIIQGASEFAYDTSGTLRILRYRLPDGGWHWFAAGDSYYRQFPTRFIVTVPCLGYLAMEENGGVVYKPSMCFGRFQHQKDIPLTEETLLEYITDPNVHDIIDMEHITDNEQFDAMVRQILNRTRTIQVEEVDRTTSERHVIFEYEIILCWDQSRELVYSEQIVHPDRHVEVIIDRPLRGVPIVDESMYNQHGLHPMSYRVSQISTAVLSHRLSPQWSLQSGRPERALGKAV